MSELKIEFTVPGKPVGKERPRLGKGKVYTPRRTLAYEQTVGWAALAVRPKEWKLNLSSYEISLKICYRKQPGRIPDIDNVAKSILDGLNGVVYDDDKLIRKLTIERFMDAKEDCVMVFISY